MLYVAGGGIPTFGVTLQVPLGIHPGGPLFG